MKNRIQKSIMSGILATIAMTVPMAVGAAIGLPKMSPPEMLSGMMKVPPYAGWIMHFMIGIIFAAGYVFLFNKLLGKITNNLIRGVVYGIIVFIIAQISFPVMGAIFGDAGMPQPEGSMALLMTESVVAHIIFGFAVSMFATPEMSFTKQATR